MTARNRTFIKNLSESEALTDESEVLALKKRFRGVRFEVGAALVAMMRLTSGLTTTQSSGEGFETWAANFMSVMMQWSSTLFKFNRRRFEQLEEEALYPSGWHAPLTILLDIRSVLQALSKSRRTPIDEDDVGGVTTIFSRSQLRQPKDDNDHDHSDDEDDDETKLQALRTTLQENLKLQPDERGRIVVNAAHTP